MFDQLPILIEQLKTPEYLHLVLHPLLVHGLLLCGILALFCMVLRQKVALAVVLVLTALCAGAAFPYLTIRTEIIPELQLSHDHHLASEIEGITTAFSKVIWIYYAISGLAFLAAATLPLKKKLWVPLTVLTICGALYGAGLAASYHLRESRIYHPNLESPGEIHDLNTPLTPSTVPPEIEFPSPRSSKRH
ncbi:hypothetical protein [Sulfuriroseicoccus oceanibius]|uniref:Uncharacterized protein n=1 Tax=Sulfuriroseicoccus oceanibius TaxID=2707525 RepID=A0A6B3L629_9BACT|nr:hypothetical protein [Sulfuriroseicoccus oceanibius]QQL46011.1 hypothetical protein G3M56_005375 [Sulfuriroseicoccus oceanibius]